ncbi:MAG: hypothetical protein QME85_11635 [Candidatus Saccharicenans sp.]|nr:hypothetical protein [Candidatus Saccharicenans sp.]
MVRFRPINRGKRTLSVPFHIVLIILGLTVLASALFSEVVMPGDAFYPGWKKSGQLITFTRADLYNYIDGGAELFLEFGFEKLYVQRYRSGESELSLEIYEMESPESALGVYLAKCGQEVPVEGLAARNTGEPTQFTILRERYFIHLNNFEGRKELFPAMLALAQATLQNLPPDRPVTLLDYLPKENLVKNSERLIRGPYALQPIFTFGEGDILQLEGKVFGVVGSYRDEAGAIFTRIIIPYPDELRAQAALKHLLQNFDPYHKIIESAPAGFIFIDYQQKYGLVKLKDRMLEILINLPETGGHFMMSPFSCASAIFSSRKKLPKPGTH